MFRSGFSALAAKMMVGEVEVKERPRPSPDYLMQLLNEKKLMTSLPNLCGIFTHLERLLDEGKWRSGTMWDTQGRGVSVTTAQSGPGTTQLGDPAAQHITVLPILPTVEDIMAFATSVSKNHTPKTRNTTLAPVSLFNLSHNKIWNWELRC